MERALVLYRNLTGSETIAFQKLRINLYSDRKVYEKERKKHKLAGDGGTGFYSPAPPSAIHFLWSASAGDHPFLTLVHEGFHQHAHYMAIADKQLNPLSTKPNFPVVIPIWLNEGVAQFVEGAVVTENRFEPGRIHQARLVHLQNLIKTKKVPDLKRLLNHSYDDPFDNADYSAAWGIAFALYHGLSSSGEWCFDNYLRDYLGKLKHRLLLNDNTELSWTNILAKESLRVFEQSVHEQGNRLSDWEKTWHLAMLSLDPNLPYGGLGPVLNEP